MTISIKSPTSTTGSIQKNGSDVLTIDSSDNVTVVNNLSVTGTLSQGGSVVQSPWTTTGSDIYYTTGNVGIGNSSPSSILDINDSSTTDVELKIFNTNTPVSGETTQGVSTNYYLANGSGGRELAGQIRTGKDNHYVGGGSIRAAHMSFSVQQSQTSFIEAMRIDSSGNLKFNSGYGSSATAYGVRAWINFNGTGTVSILDSGNISSLTDNGVGDYTISFTNAMPDTNYVMTGNYDYVYNGTQYFDQQTVPRTFATGSLRINQGHAATNYNDAERVMVSIIR